MKSFLLFIFVFLTVALSNAQIGIGTTSPNAQLDITATNSTTPANTDGILIPRVTAFPVTNPTSSQNGMLIFLTTATGSNQPGFYYWNNATTAWLGVGSTLTNNWGLLGNTSTSSSTNFIGTTDDVDIVLKRNNVRAGFIGNPTIATGNMNTSLGANSLVNPSATGTRNVAIGTNTLPANTTGARNISIGDQSSYQNVSGTDNIAIGAGALYSNSLAVSNVAIGNNSLVSTTSGNNTAVGYFAMSGNTTGIYNTAIGREALRINSTGSYNVSLGYRAGYSTAALGSNNVFLGTNAGYNETGSNKLYIDNTGNTTVPTSIANSSTTALIYGDFASSPKILRTNSQFQIGDPSGSGYVFPTTRGTVNQYLSTNASGVLSWTSLAAVSTDWSTTGNASIVDGTNYIGTDAATDVDVAFRRKNLAAGKIGTTNTSFGLGALASNTGTNNTAHGVNALNATTSGTNNTAVGYQAGNANLTGANNVLIGYQAGLVNTTSGNVNIGNQAGAAETTANKLYIENSNADANSALIYGDFGSNPKILRTNGQLQISNPATTGYALPTTRGTSGQVLQTDGSGGTSWADGNSNLSIARTNLSGNQSLGTGGWQKISFNTVLFDTKSEFNTGSNRFIATKAGYYQINACFHTDNQSNSQYYSIGVYVNGSLYQQVSGNHISNGQVSRNVNCIVSLAAGGYVEIYAENYQSSVNIDSYSGKTYFEVKQIK